MLIVQSKQKYPAELAALYRNLAFFSSSLVSIRNFLIIKLMRYKTKLS